MEKRLPKCSIVILTYNRPDEITRNVRELVAEFDDDVEIIVVDNCSETEVSRLLTAYSSRIKVIRLARNMGVSGRNVGISAAVSEIIVSLDDDVFGFSRESLEKVVSQFENSKSLAALNFKVVDDKTLLQMNWIHHRRIEHWGDKPFETYEISEGAVALRKRSFTKAGGYMDDFFISHEGPDLALRLMKAGETVEYNPEIVVRHAHSLAGRESWRRYYYDTRNLIWLTLRHFPVALLAKKMLVGLGAQFIYSLRDGYFKYWLKGIVDAIKGIKKIKKTRDPINGNVLREYRRIESYNPGLPYMIKIRLFKKDGIKI
ncbi:MAG: glycosyltransferase [Marinobacter sp.]|uniref:glycosyltransferase family 2 protein n=1 Tax=Marinobacter sp. TaxID=50741 RepID=UPI00299E0E23|nr:glycosyltransferase [Marinobacter sp.]MDX1754886.1 glycosyltransferase [Marinobacter sp.]